MKVTGAITQIKEKVTGISKSDKGWSKVEFLLETSEDYNNVYCFEIFAMDDAEKNNVDSFMKFNKVGSNVDVEFNVKTSEWKGNIIDKTKNTIIGNSQGVFIEDDGSTEMFFNYSINIIYYTRVCNISNLEALKIFGTVID